MRYDIKRDIIIIIIMQVKHIRVWLKKKKLLRFKNNQTRGFFFPNFMPYIHIGPIIFNAILLSDMMDDDRLRKVARYGM